MYSAQTPLYAGITLSYFGRYLLTVVLSPCTRHNPRSALTQVATALELATQRIAAKREEREQLQARTKKLKEERLKEICGVG